MRVFTAKNIVITGAGSGIGRALAIEFARLNAFLILSDNDSKTLLETQKILKDMQIDSACYELDVSDYQAMNNFAASVHRHYGDIDMLINNAGVTLMDKFEGGNLADFHWVMNINFWGTVNGVKAFLPNLLKRKDACIVNLSSIFGIMGMPGQAAYNSSKFAVKGFTEALKMELSDTSVQVCSVHPGGVKTEIANNARVGINTSDVSRAKLLNEFDRLTYTSAEKAAKEIIKGVQKNKRRIMIGVDAKIVDIIVRLFPGTYENIMGLEKRIKKLS